MTLDENPASLQCTPAHLRVEGKVAEAGVSCKPPASTPHQVVEIVPHSHLAFPGGHKVGRSGWKQCGKSTGHITLCGELIHGIVSPGRPWHNLVLVRRLPFRDGCTYDVLFVHGPHRYGNKGAHFMGVLFVG